MDIEDIKTGMSDDDQRAAAKDILSVLRSGDDDGVRVADFDGKPVPERANFDSDEAYSVALDKFVKAGDKSIGMVGILAKSAGELSKSEIERLQDEIRDFLNGRGDEWW